MYAYIQNGDIQYISHEIPEVEGEIIEYDDHIVNPLYRDGEIIEYIDEEAEKKSRVRTALITSPDLSSVDLEGVLFSDIEIGEIIRSRVFAGNHYAESALQAKTSAYLLSVIQGNPNEEILVSIQEKQARINEVRAKLNLTII